jgi:hypothetical protein
LAGNGDPPSPVSLPVDYVSAVVAGCLNVAGRGGWIGFCLSLFGIFEFILSK